MSGKTESEEDRQVQLETSVPTAAELQEEQRVWIVLANYDDDPHPHVEEIYTNEKAAERHKKSIRDAISAAGPVAWKVGDTIPKETIESCPICGEDVDIDDEEPDEIGYRTRCPDCHSKI